MIELISVVRNTGLAPITLSGKIIICINKSPFDNHATLKPTTPNDKNDR